MDSSRTFVLKELLKVSQKDQYANLKAASFSESVRGSDGAFLARLFFGVLERKITLDFILNQFLKKPVDTLPEKLQWILRMAVYQLYFMDKVPAYAAINESVNLTKKQVSPNFAKLVNGVLRNVSRTDFETLIQKVKQDPVLYLSYRYSFLPEMTAYYLDLFGREKTEKILNSYLEQSPMFLRLNTLKGEKEQILQLLSSCGVAVEETELTDMVKVSGLTDLSHFPLLQEGFVYVQGMSSALTSALVGAEPGERVLDVCSAPGGKTTHMAALMKNKGEIVALDLYEHRLSLVRENAKKMGAAIIQTKQADGSILQPQFVDAFDRVLLDVPCSNTGILKKRPDIKNKLNRENIQSLASLQEKILKTSSKYVKINGSLLYSTCSIDPMEDEELADSFTKAHPEFQPVDLRELLPPSLKEGQTHPWLKFFSGSWRDGRLFYGQMEKGEIIWKKLNYWALPRRK